MISTSVLSPLVDGLRREYLIYQRRQNDIHMLGPDPIVAGSCGHKSDAKERANSKLHEGEIVECDREVEDD